MTALTGTGPLIRLIVRRYTRVLRTRRRVGDGGG